MVKCRLEIHGRQQQTCGGVARQRRRRGQRVSRQSCSSGPHRKVQAGASSLQGVRQEGDAAPGEGSPASAEAPTSSLPGGPQ